MRSSTVAVLLLSLVAGTAGHAQDAVRLFDFGTADSVTREGFTKVTHEDLFTPERGYGFVSIEGLKALDRGGWEKKPISEYHVSRYGLTRTTSFTTCDFVEGPTPGVFQVSVPDGEYEVWYVVCDANHAPPFFDIRANGETRAQVRVPRRRHVCCEPLRARATDGLLSLELTGDHGWLLNALAIGPPGPELDAITAHLERTIFFETDADLGNWTEVATVSPNPQPEYTQAERERGYVSFVRDYTELVYPSAVPTRDEIERPLTAFASPGEFEPASFSLCALRELGAVDVEVADLVAPGGDVIPASQVDVGIVRCWPQRTGSTRGPSGQFTVMPELIDPATGRRHIVGEGQVKQWWLTVHVPDDAAPGRYMGTVHIKPADAPASELQWRLLVLPIELARPEGRHWGTWLDGFPPLGYLAGPASRGRNTVEERARIARAEVIDFRDHGFDTALLPAGGIKVTVNPDGAFAYDLGSLPEQLEYLKILGSDCAVTLLFEGLCRRLEYKYADEPRDEHVAGTFSARAREAIVGLIRFIDAEARSRGWPTIYYYPIDEPGNSKTENRYTFAENVLDMVHEVPGCQTTVTLTANCLRRLGEERVDLRLYAYGHYTRDKALADAADGRPFWYYANGMFYGESPTMSRGLSGFDFLRSGASCATAWGFAATYANPHNDFDGGHEDWNVLIPGAGAPTPTIYWELCREGVDDARYAATLEREIERARAAGNNDRAADAERVLTSVVDPALPRIDNTAAFHRLRWRLAREILSLSGGELVEPLPGLAVARVPVAGEQFEPNVIENPSFENGPGEDGLPGWPYPFSDPFVATEEKPVGAISVSEEMPHTGRYSLKWDVGVAKDEGGSTDGKHRWLVINVQIADELELALRGRRVRVGMWVRIGGGPVTPSMRLRQFGGGKYLDAIAFRGGITDPTVWNHYQAQGRLRTDFDGLDIHTYCRIPKDPKAAKDALFYIDDVYLQALRESPLKLSTSLDEYYVGEAIAWEASVRAPAARVEVQFARGEDVVRRWEFDDLEPGATPAGEVDTSALAPGVYTLRATARPPEGGPEVSDWREVLVAPDPFAW